MRCWLLEDALEVAPLNAHVLADRRNLLRVRSLSKRSHAQMHLGDEPTAIPLRLHAEDHPWQEQLHEPEGGRELDVLMRNHPREDDLLLNELSRDVMYSSK